MCALRTFNKVVVTKLCTSSCLRLQKQEIGLRHSPLSHIRESSLILIYTTQIHACIPNRQLTSLSLSFLHIHTQYISLALLVVHQQTTLWRTASSCVKPPHSLRPVWLVDRREKHVAVVSSWQVVQSLAGNRAGGQGGWNTHSHKHTPHLSTY